MLTLNFLFLFILICNSTQSISVKIGQCPAYPQGLSQSSCSYVKFSSLRCSVDEECGGYQKCCFNGCEMTCQDPSKPGSCPYDIRVISVRTWNWKECSNDYQCYGNQKCCVYGWRKSCQSPLWAKPHIWTKPGLCPNYYSVTSDKIKNSIECTNDYQCNGNQKCCVYGWRKSCQSPLWAKPHVWTKPHIWTKHYKHPNYYYPKYKHVYG